nr:hypothetical protein [Tanacetum cinerariifolium]
MFYRENVDYPELIWEHLAYQIDHKKDKRSRRKNMPFLRITKVIINYFLKQHNPLSNLKFQHYHTIKDDSNVCRLKFVRIDVHQVFYWSDSPKKSKGKGKSISKSKAKEAEAARQVHATHARIVTESIPEPTKRRKSRKVTSDPPKNLKGIPSLTLEEQEAADIMQALKESKETSKRQPGTGTKPGVFDEEKDITKENVILKWGSEQESKYSEENKLDDDEKDDKEGETDDEDDETEFNEDDIYKYKIRVRKDEDEKMLNADVEDSDKGDEEVTDAAKADAEKTSKVKDDTKNTELHLTSSSLSISLGFGDQFLKLYFDSSLVSTVKDTIDAEINSLLEVKIQSKVPHNQSLSMLSVPMSMIFEPSVMLIQKLGNPGLDSN